MSVKVIEGERGKERLINEPGEAGADDPTDGRGKISERLTREEMQEELDKRVEMMRTGNGGDGVTDQYREYQFIIGELEKGNKFVRLMVQASVRALSALTVHCSSCKSVKGVAHRPSHRAPPTEAGTGKSFLLTTVFLWCLCRKKKVKAAAPYQTELSSTRTPAQ